MDGVDYYLSEVNNLKRKPEKIGKLVYAKDTEMSDRVYRQWTFCNEGNLLKKKRFTTIHQIESVWTRNQEEQMSNFFRGDFTLFVEVESKVQSKDLFTHVFGRVVRIKLRR